MENYGALRFVILKLLMRKWNLSKALECVVSFLSKASRRGRLWISVQQFTSVVESIMHFAFQGMACWKA